MELGHIGTFVVSDAEQKQGDDLCPSFFLVLLAELVGGCVVFGDESPEPFSRMT